MTLNKALGGKVDEAQLSRAVMLSKTDLVTNMVFEFPDLQGIMGNAYALNDGEEPAVALAIEEHYMPRNAQDDFPSSDLGALVGIADRLDTVVGIFATGKGPTGAADPYGLRRAVIAIINIVKSRDWHVSLAAAVKSAIAELSDKLQKKSAEQVETEVLDFFAGRLKGVLTSQGVSKDVADAAISAGFDNFIDLEGRAKALAKLRTSGDFEPIAIAFKRVANILKGKAHEDFDSNALVESAELKLLEAIQEIQEEVKGHVKIRDFEAAFAAIASLRPPVDKFFEDVMVMDEDLKVRNARLGLLGKLSKIFEPMADFTRLN